MEHPRRPPLDDTTASAERELDRAQLETLVAHAPVAIVVVDAASRRVLRANAEAERLLGIARGARFVRRYRGFDLDGREYSSEEWPLERTLAGGEVVAGRLIRLELPDGSRRTMSQTTAPVRIDGRTVAAVLIVDVDRAFRATAHRGFVTNAAHELQTPIAAITSAVDVLQSGAKERRHERDLFLGHIERAVDRLGRLTRALLLLARAQSAEPPRREVLPLAPLLESVAGRFAGPVTVTCEPDLAAISNTVLLEQALVSLVENALKHAQTPVTVVAATRGVHARIEVSDTGPGIEPKIRPHVFDGFFRGDESPGFGLGLSIAREAVSAMGGELELESDTSGTRVSVVLPGAKVRS